MTRQYRSNPRIALRLLVLALGALLLAACDGGVSVEEEPLLADGFPDGAPAGPKFLYVSRISPFFVDGLSIDPATGALSPVPGSPWSIPEEALDIEADPTGRHLYVPVQNNTSLHTFLIDPNTGSLSEELPPVTTSSAPAGVVVHPSGNFVYVPLYFSPNVEIFARNPTTGALTSLGLSPSTGGSPNLGAAMHPSGAYLYVSSQGGNSIKAFSINQGSGALTDNGSQAANTPRRMSLDPTGSYLYAGSANTTFLYAFAVTPGTGVLTPLSPATYTAGGSTRALDFHRTSTGYVVVTEIVNGGVASYAFNGGNGALSYVGSFATGTIPSSVAICDDFVFVSHATDTHIAGHRIDPGSGLLFPTAQGSLEMTERMDDLEPVGCS